MNSDNLIKMENGGTYTRPCQCKDGQPTDKMIKYFIIIITIAFFWMVCITGFSIYIYHRVENQINARPCTCLQAGGTERGQEDNAYDGNTPQEDHLSREKRSHGQVSQSIYVSLRLYVMA